jgi:hypothetical protein
LGKVIVVLVVVVLITSIVLYYSHLKAQSGSEVSENTILVPLYSGDPSQFQDILNLQSEYRNVHFFIIINPNNGSGNAPNTTFSEWINRSEAAGITVLGYVYTSYGNRSMVSIMGDVHNYSKWYGIHAIFFDEVSDNSSGESFYSSLVAQSRVLGISITIGNPGDFVPYGYLSIFNVTVIYEDQGYPSVSSLEGYAQNVSKDRLAVIAYGVPFSSSETISIGAIAGFTYFSDQTLPDPYQNLSSYLPEIASTFS